MAFAGGCSQPADDHATRTSPNSIRADSAARARQDSINRTLPGYVVDSILPVDEELRRFRAAAGGATVAGFRGGSDTPDKLVRRFMRAVAKQDTAELRSMLLDAHEFGDLVYPESPYTHAPYRQPPGLVWNQIQNPSVSGLTRLVRRLGGQPLAYIGYKCAPRPDRQGRNLIWTGCIVRVIDRQGEVTRHRLFGSVIQRDNQFKFVSYSNEF
jgi:hypothetical protein